MILEAIKLFEYFIMKLNSLISKSSMLLKRFKYGARVVDAARFYSSGERIIVCNALQLTCYE